MSEPVQETVDAGGGKLPEGWRDDLKKFGERVAQSLKAGSVEDVAKKFAEFESRLSEVEDAIAAILKVVEAPAVAPTDVPSTPETPPVA